MRTENDIRYCMTDGIPNECIIKAQQEDIMNNKLKKETKRDDYQKKYMAKHRAICIHLDKKEDKNIIRWLDRQENKSKAVREALREAIKE